MMAAEVSPLSKTGGLADVAGALTRYLHKAGHRVRLFTPFYSLIDRSRLEIRPVDFLQDIPLEFAHHRYRYSVFEARLPGSDATAYLIDCPVLYSRPVIYTTDVDEHLRFIALTRATIECCQRMQWSPQIIHCNDWHTAFAPLYIKRAYEWDRLFARTRTVLTIHNIGYQGTFGADKAVDVGLGDKTYLLHQDDLRAGTVNPLKHGILYADHITTVSPTHAKEICTPEYGMGLDELLRARSDSVTGILNGVDYQEWDPRHDRYLPHHFDAERLEGKRTLKKALMRRLNMDASPDAPLMGIVSRLAAQKGFDIAFDSLPEVLAWRDLSLVALGSGEEKYESFFRRLQREFPGRVVFRSGHDDELAHWIEAACDMFLMPSLYEPCGLNQMYSLKYGTVPIVRRTGGLADSVRMWDPATRLGTGIVFNEFDVPAVRWAIHTALDLFRDSAAWQQMMHNGMAQDFSWHRQCQQYLQLYRELLAAP